MDSKLQNLIEKIRELVVFFDIFDYPLDLAEFKSFVGDIDDGFKIEDILKNERDIETRDGFYFLTGRSEVVEIRHERSKILKKYQFKINKMVSLLKIVPFVKMVAVCNTVAFNSPDESSDIDLFVVTKSNRIFIARTLATVLMHLFGVRRHGDKIKGRFCLSFFVSEKAMEMEKIKILPKDIYLEYWIKTLKPVIGYKYYEMFMAKNLWAKGLINFDNHNKKYLNDKVDVLDGMGLIGEKILGAGIGDLIENKLERIHLKRYEKRKKLLGKNADVIVNRKMLKFHNVDRRAVFNEMYLKKMQELGWSKKSIN